MFIGKRAWKCPRCGYVGVPDSIRLGERLGTAIGGIIGGFVGYCAFGSFTQFPVPRAENYRGLVSGLLFGASTGNQIGRVLDAYLIHLCRCPSCQKITIS